MGARDSGGSGFVYSTRDGRLCPRCDQPLERCECRTRASALPAESSSGLALDGIVRVGRQTQGRKGKGVTLISGLALEPSRLSGLAKELKRLCGSGGTVKDGTIEIQGNHVDAVVAELQARGWKVKRVGG